jgi:hypothetical protein
MSAKGKRLVIDTSVCLSPGGHKADDEQSITCTEILENVYCLKYYFVCTPEVQSEISRHLDAKLTKYVTKYTVDWFARMRRRGKIISINETENIRLREKIKTKKFGKRQLIEVLKDIHLIEAANATDNKIISHDKTAYGYFKRVSDIDEISIVVWMDMNNPDQDIIKWLKSGAKNKKEHMLGFNPGDN